MGKVKVSMSQQPLTDQDYTDGEIKKLVPGSAMWEALFTEDWLNCSLETKTYYLDRLSQKHYFSGCVISLVRGQVELTYVPLNPATNGPGEIKIISITLSDVQHLTA